MENLPLTIGLSLVFVIVLAGPFLNKTIERNLEVFLLAMGLISATVSGVWSGDLFGEGLRAPVEIALAVLAAGFFFYSFRGRLDAGMTLLLDRVPLWLVILSVVILLGLVSSLISAIIAALVLVEFISMLRLHRRAEVNLTIVACFGIGLGSALTPTGSPLTAIAVSQLHAGFFYVVELIGLFIVLTVILFGIIAMLMVRRVPDDEEPTLTAVDSGETLLGVLVRGVKAYVFVMALIFFGAGFRPLIYGYFVGVPHQALFWINMASAILDNAALAAAEIGPALSTAQIKAALLGLLISGGMLIPGNIANIIAANKLEITSSEWARLGVPLGLLIMAVTWGLMILGVV